VEAGGRGEDEEVEVEEVGGPGGGLVLGDGGDDGDEALGVGGVQQRPETTRPGVELACRCGFVMSTCTVLLGVEIGLLGAWCVVGCACVRVRRGLSCGVGGGRAFGAGGDQQGPEVARPRVELTCGAREQAVVGQGKRRVLSNTDKQSKSCAQHETGWLKSSAGCRWGPAGSRSGPFRASVRLWGDGGV
jgi:hypothetical protein